MELLLPSTGETIRLHVDPEVTRGGLVQTIALRATMVLLAAVCVAPLQTRARSPAAAPPSRVFDPPVTQKTTHAVTRAQARPRP